MYNSPFRKDPDPRELRLQKAKPSTHRRPKVKQKPAVSPSSWLACTSARSFPRCQILPPIDRKQCQVLISPNTNFSSDSALTAFSKKLLFCFVFVTRRENYFLQDSILNSKYNVRLNYTKEILFWYYI